ncbi:MAG: SCP2 sterol-binding domain-containing protein [Polyangiaceae bacterium]|nr:SCP2 sterol-binding domain-containing protein [Polyangiaceae bacterium]
MKPISLPAGTTVTSFLEEVLAAEHATRVTDDAAETHVIHARVDGLGEFTVTVRGRELSVERGLVGKAQLWVATDLACAERALADALGDGALLPDVRDPSSVPAVTDPRLLRRLAMVSGTVRAELTGFGDAPLWVAFGAGAKASRIDDERTDAEVSVPMSVLSQLLTLSKRPDEALKDAAVKTKGNLFVPMQVALALAILLPAGPQR